MAFCELKYYSPALEKAIAADIILPETDVKGPFAVFYLLHGLSDDHTIWHRRTSIERYVQDLPLIVVMPDGGRGFYCDGIEGAKWETSIVRDLVNYVDKIFPTKANRTGRAIGGLSMGGYGAVKLAMKYPDLFCSANSHSGAVAFGHYPLIAEKDADTWHASFTAEFKRVVGEHPEGGPDDIFALAEKLPVEKRPAVRIDCGKDDFLIEANRAAHAHLEKIGYAHEYAEFPGSHEWSYWDVHVQEALAFHLRNLKIKTKKK